MKPIEFLGDSLERLRALPKAARQRTGFQLDRLQRGLDPSDWKPLNVVGPGVRELRVRHESGAYRIIYFAGSKKALYVLHCYQKKTRATPKGAIERAAIRYREVTGSQ